jgi:hypothetical protein
MRKELEQLIFSGILTDTVEIAGKLWTIQTISITEHTDVVAKLKGDNNTLNLLALKTNLVIKSLKSIDDIVLDDEKEKTEFVKKLPLPIIDKLFTTYDALVDKLNKELTNEDLEEIKNS